jgi:plasmid stabilization system protein ParE
MSLCVIITPTAEAEVLESFRWYADRSHAAAQRWYAGLKRTMERLSEKPDRFPVSP